MASAAIAAGDVKNMKSAEPRDAPVRMCVFAGFAGRVVTAAAAAIVFQAGNFLVRLKFGSTAYNSYKLGTS